jgi:hypothetical protein
MIDEFGDEERFSREFFNLLGVLRVVAERARGGLGKAGGHKETRREQNTKQAADHEAPQGITIAEDYIGYSAQGRNPKVDDAWAFGL